MEPAPVLSPPREISVGTVEVGTLKGSELSPSVGGAVPMTGVPDEEVGASIRLVAPAPVGARVAEAEKPAVPDVGPTSGTTWACATSRVESHTIIMKVNIRSIAFRLTDQSIDE
jgi:hypothetical protein